jgi:hypothetical protein
MRRKWGLGVAGVLVVAAAVLFLVDPSEPTGALVFVALIPFVWVAADRDGPLGASPPGPWSGVLP